MTAPSAVLYLTHIWNSVHALRFRRLTRQAAGIADCYVLFQDAGNDVPGRHPAEDVDAVHVFRVSDLPARLGYDYLTPGGIVPGCTHFPLIDFAKTHSYQHYWLIESDVEFSGDWADLLRAGEATKAGLLAAHVRRHSEAPAWPWWSSLSRRQPADTVIPNRTDELLKAFLCLYRISRDALQVIDHSHRDGWTGHSEVILPSAISSAGLGVVDLMRLKAFYQGTAPNPDADAAELSTLRFRPEISLLEFIRRFSPDTIYHPVKEGWAFDGTDIVVARPGGWMRLSLAAHDSDLTSAV